MGEGTGVAVAVPVMVGAGVSVVVAVGDSLGAGANVAVTAGVGVMRTGAGVSEGGGVAERPQAERSRLNRSKTRVIGFFDILMADYNLFYGQSFSAV